MPRSLTDCLTRQFDLAWKLASYHLETLSTEECLWRPAASGLHVWEREGRWRADWPDRESYDLGPASIGWLTWHWDYWWSMVIDHSIGAGSLTREGVSWSGSADSVRTRLNELHDRWSRLLSSLDDDQLLSSERTRWPFRDRPFADVVAWANVELTKSAAEVGYARFLFAAASHRLQR